MRGKSGFLRIVEAFIAVMIIAGVMGYVYVQRIQKPDEADSVNQIERIILSEIANSEELRNAVLNGDSGNNSIEAVQNRTIINNTIKKSVPKEYEFSFRICALNLVCELEEYTNKEVFANEAIISSTLSQYNPKKLRIFLWRKD